MQNTLNWLIRSLFKESSVTLVKFCCFDKGTKNFYELRFRDLFMNVE